MATELIQKLAKVGAQMRLAELRREIGDITSMFPDIASEGAQNGAGRGLGATTTTSARGKPRAAPKMSQAARRKVSLRMKRYWKERRKAQQPQAE